MDDLLITVTYEGFSDTYEVEVVAPTPEPTPTPTPAPTPTPTPADAPKASTAVHVQRIGWMAWTKNGSVAGTQGMSRRVEAVQIVLVRKGEPAPTATHKGVRQNYAKPFARR